MQERRTKTGEALLSHASSIVLMLNHPESRRLKGKEAIPELKRGSDLLLPEFGLR
jgi:hypothetical protein